MKKITLCYHCLTTYFYYLEIVQPCNQKNNVVMGPQEKKWPVQLNKCAAVCFYYTMENKTGHIFSLTVCLQSSWASLWRIKEQNGVKNCHRKSWGCCLPVSKHAPSVNMVHDCSLKRHRGWKCIRGWRVKSIHRQRCQTKWRRSAGR